jgi:hypothetical protein
VSSFCQLYPNPANGWVSLTVGTQTDFLETILVSQTGAMHRLTPDAQRLVGGKLYANFSISRFSAGLYTLVIKTSEQTFQKKIGYYC